mgnify:CR=1 FL=1
MKDFKFFKDNDTQLSFGNCLFAIQPQIRYDNVEFCFQFNDEEPVVFGRGPNDLRIHISPSPNGNVTFNDNERVFKIFARERQND